MNNTTLTPSAVSLSGDAARLATGIAVGLLAASIGALYTVYARWGIARGLSSPDLTALRFGIAGLVLLPVLLTALIKQRTVLSKKWRVWIAVSMLAGTPFGLLMFGALQFTPSSHAAVFPFAAMSVMGMLIGALVLRDRITHRKALGIAVVVFGLVLVSGIDQASFTNQTLMGDAMFIAAGTLWAYFGVLLRKHSLDPLLATSVIAFSALVTYVPVYLWATGAKGLIEASSEVFWTEALIQGVIAGTGTLFTYAKMVSILGPTRAAVFPALAPGIAALIAWPILGHKPGTFEILGLIIVIAGLLFAVTGVRKS
ncbi:DMT family transporter [Undibacterium parvum]|uniref:DMT family transporter n=2 Tax=Undibacterium TaxID=401469 RepID=A0A6M4A975_9BURK|nr:DMT family transporter [Undibacterium parvum]AZP12944.1 DMT family transporter [Undibacterium parvum]QJQ07087.1 DMT family transporter [Undibacterium piscinae]